MREKEDEPVRSGALFSAPNLDGALASIFLSGMPWRSNAENRRSGTIKTPEGDVTFTITAPDEDMVTADDKVLLLYLVRKIFDGRKTGDVPDREISFTLEGYLKDTQRDPFPEADQMIANSLRRLQATQFKLDIEAQGKGVLQMFRMIASFDYDYDLVEGRNVIKSFRVRLSDFLYEFFIRKSAMDPSGWYE